MMADLQRFRALRLKPGEENRLICAGATTGKRARAKIKSINYR
jgi:hypothetical protein